MVATTIAPASAVAAPDVSVKDGVSIQSEAMEHMMDGRRNFLCEDYAESVSSLAMACEMLAKQFGETANECADSYFHYGKALLELARMEGGVLGNALEGVPEGEDTEDSQVESADKMTEDEKEEVGSKVMEALEENFVEHEEKVASLLDGHKKAVETDEIEEGLESMDVYEKTDKKSEEVKKSEDMDAQVEKKSEEVKKSEDMEAEKKPEEVKKPEDMEVEKKSEEIKKPEDMEAEVDKKSEEVKTPEDMEAEVEKKSEEVKKPEDMEAVVEKKSEEVKQSEDMDAEVEKKSEDMDAFVENEDLSNLQRAWEVLELAKVIYTRMIKDSKNELNEKKLCETLLALGEVSIENETWSTAVEDLQACLVKRKELAMDSRLIAETHYHLGVALCYDSKFDEAIKNLNDAKDVLIAHLGHLKTDTFNARVGEIDELELLLPEIDDKIKDTLEIKAHPEKMKESMSGFPKSTMGSKPATAIQTKKK